jgi:GNAT superfamily N-acetyltransferase
MNVVVVPARPVDLPAIAGIERAGGRMLAAYLGVTGFDDVTPFDQLEDARARGRLWVARGAERPVGFALARRLDGEAHLEEVDVLPAYGRQGIGSRLVGTVRHWATREGCRYLTLTTFRTVPWNMPFYARLGFELLAPQDWTPALAQRVAEETERGLDPATRVVMRLRCATEHPGDRR